MNHRVLRLAVLAFCLGLLHCTSDSASDPEFSAPVPKAGAGTPTTRFVRQDPKKIGVDFVQEFRENYEYSFIYDPSIYNGGGVAVIDVDNDGFQDLFFISRQMECKLYRNKGDFTFEDITDKAGVSGKQGLKTGATVVDINGDGWQDIYVCRTGLKPSPDRVNLLFINNGNGTFSEKAKAYGLDDISASQHANFFDYDLDGDLDVYVLNQPVDNENIQTMDFNPAGGKTARSQPPRKIHDTDRLFRNNGNGTFTDVSQQAGIWNRAWGLSVTVSDMNDDGYPDIVIGNDFIQPDFLYINNGNGTFTDKADDYFRHYTNHTMGVDIADLNNDALLDILALDMLAEPWDRRKRLMTTMVLQRYKLLVDKTYGHQLMRNTLQLNNGNGSFSEIGCLAGMFATDWSWAVLAADYDNDGWKDIFISNGIFRDLNDLDFQTYTIDSINRTGGVHPGRFPDFNQFSSLMPSQKVRNYMYQNNGSLQFQDVSESWGFTDPGCGNGAAYVDLDNDGDLDLVVNNAYDPSAIYQNQANQMNKNNWLQIKCKGTAGNPGGTGAKIWVYFGGQVFYQEMTPIRGFFSSIEPILQIGMGAIKTAERVEIEWPDKRHQILLNVPAGQRLTLDVAAASPGRLPRAKETPAPVFEEVTARSGLDFVHRENHFEDFDREKLLPYRLSTQGPAIASADVNGDGLADVFLGGAREQAAAIFLRSANGTYRRLAQPALEADLSFEDVAAVFTDADADGDADLYVVSGGNEEKAFAESYQDRLYLNDGKGNFSRAPNALPRETSSGGCVTAYDFDGDGDEDLFVGGRVTPGAFPQPAQTLVLRNDRGVYQDVAAALAPDLRYAGMVTDIQFGDLNGDGKAEMIVVGDWMPVSVYRYDGNKYVQASADFGLEQSHGWWNCLLAADVDGDGDIDLVAGNEGLNTRFRPTPEAPLKIYASDFDGNGSVDPVMAVAYAGHYVPVAMRDMLVSQIQPGGVKKKFPNHASYSSALLTDLFPEETLKASLRLRANTFASAWFENQNGKFIQHDLPDEAQFAPMSQAFAADFNGDGKTDLLTLGNDYTATIETGIMDASNGCLLLGDGKGGWKAMPNRHSGLWATKEARKAVWDRKSGVLLIANNNDRVQVFDLE